MPGMLQLTAAAMLALAAHVSSQSQPGDDLLFNQVQFVGTDQSHHQAPPQAVLDLLDQPLYQNAFANSSLGLPQGYFFSHLSITDQLNAGVRGFEFDVQQDNSTGGKFAYSAALKLANASSALISPDLLKPGLKVFSTPDFDFGSSCYLFTDCLQQIANWSAANPNHFPVSVFIHKGSSTPPQTTLGNAYGPALQQLQATNGEPMNFTTGTAANLTDVTAEILSVFNRSQLYTPDDLRADNNASSDAALRDIVFPNGALNGSWPTIGRLRNKILIMADPDYLTTISPLYPNATNTLFWFADDQGDTDPNVVVLDAYVDVALQNTSTPLPYALDDNADSLSEAAAQGTEFVVLQGFFVRAGADVSSVEAANNYTYRRDIVASQGGPQFLATLFETLPPQSLIPSTYQVNPATIPGFNGAEAICNPVTTGSQINAGSDAFPFDGAIPQLGASSVIQEPPPCPIPAGFSAGKFVGAPATAAADN